MQKYIGLQAVKLTWTSASDCVHTFSQPLSCNFLVVNWEIQPEPPYERRSVGGYYLTSVYASVCLIQSQPGTPSASGLTNEARESLREWSRRRGQEAKIQRESQQNQV